MKTILPLLVALVASADAFFNRGITITKLTTVTEFSTVFPTCFKTPTPLVGCRKKKQLWFMEPIQYMPQYVPLIYAAPPRPAFKLHSSILPIAPYFAQQPLYYPNNMLYQPYKDQPMRDQPIHPKPTSFKDEAYTEKLENDVSDIESSISGFEQSEDNGRFFFNKITSLIVYKTITSVVIEMTTAKQTRTLALSCLAPNVPIPNPICQEIPVNPVPRPSGANQG